MINHTPNKRTITRRLFAKRKAAAPYALNFSVRPMDGSTEKAPAQIVLLRIAENDDSQDQLFLDRIPLPRNTWKLHPNDQTLTWRGVCGGGHIQFTQDLLTGSGVIGAALRSTSVEVQQVTSFACDVAKGAGTAMVIDGHRIYDLNWDPNSADWNNAAWIPQAMQLNNILIPPSAPWEPTGVSLSFSDLETQANWTPDADEQIASLTTVTNPNGGLGWRLSFNCDAGEAFDNRKGLTGPNDQTIDTVFPYMLRASEDAASDSITGVLLIDSNTPSGVTCGFRGQRIQTNATGYYQVQGDKPLVFGLFNGSVYIDDTLVEGARLAGNRLIGLTQTGPISFNADGSVATLEGGKSTGRRLAVHEVANVATIDDSLNLIDLLTFTSQAMKVPTDGNGNPLKDKNGNPLPSVWVDVIQQSVTQDLGTIMNASIPSDMWSNLYGNIPQTPLDAVLKIVSNTPVAGVPNPADWYTSLAVAVMTQGLAGGTNSNEQRLNAPRAQRWLKEQVAASAVYHTHGQELFRYHWNNLYPDGFPAFLEDQRTNTAYSSEMDSYILGLIPGINSIATSASSQQDMISKMIGQLQDLGNYAQKNTLFWAFALYFHITSTGILKIVANELTGGSEDSSRLTRFYQQYMTLLTALDPSGYFAKQYLQTFQIYLSTVTIPSMVDLSGDANNVDMVTRFVNQFLNDNQESSDANVQELVIELQDLYHQNPDVIENAVAEVRALTALVTDVQSFPEVALNFANWFKTTYPNFVTAADGFTTLMLGGGMVLSAFSLLQSIENWDDLDDEMKTEVCVNASQLVLQMVSGILSRGMNWGNIFATEGLSNFQRASSVFKILMGASPDELGVGLNRISGSMARWIAGAAPEGEAALAAGGAAAAEEASIAARIFGSSMCDFVATRVGTVFALAGMGFSLYHLIEGDTGLDAAADYVGYFGGALAIFAVVGGWALEGTISAAAIATLTGIAGALGIACALAGLGILIYTMLTSKPDDPVEDFVNGPAQAAGFTTPGTCSAIDYAVQYTDPDQNNLGIMGFQFIIQGGALTAQPNGTITLSPPDHSFATVWNADTNGTGVSTVMTMIDRGDGNGLVSVVLSQMVDGSVTFRDAVPKEKQSDQKILTQQWSIQPTDTATLAGNQYLKTMPVTLTPANTPPASNATVYTLTMAGRAPAAMIMRDLSFVLNSLTDTVFKPAISQIGSAPNTFSLTGAQPLPPFLDFDPTSGVISQNNLTPSAVMPPTSYTLQVKNPLGSTSATFNIQVITGTNTTI